MTSTTANQFDRTGGKIARDFNAMIADSEELLKAATTVSGEGFTAARTKFEAKVKSAKQALAEASRPMLEQTREAGAAAAEGYVRANPWTAIGLAIAAGAFIGFLAARR